MATTPAAPVEPDGNQADARICRQRCTEEERSPLRDLPDSATRNIDVRFL